MFYFIIIVIFFRNLLRCHRIPDFIFHDKFSDDEVCELFKQGESLSSEWCHTIISVSIHSDHWKVCACFEEPFLFLIKSNFYCK